MATITRTRRFDLERTQFIYDPYPIGIVSNVLPPDFYAELVDAFPPVDMFATKPSLGYKFSLSEVNNPVEYDRFIRSSRPWGEFHRYIKSPEFIAQVVSTLPKFNIDTGLELRPPTVRQQVRKVLSGVKHRHMPTLQRPLSARFEFSALPADGGELEPHTDAPQKLITLVIYMVREGEWDPAFGGGTTMYRPKDISLNYNLLNKYLRFTDVEEIHTFPFQPNACVTLIKTFNSLHGVEPMRGHGSKLWRRSVTINIERLAY